MTLLRNHPLSHVYLQILEDVNEECQNFGQLTKVVVPRNGETGVGKIFCQYAEASQAQAAALKLAGRQFASRVVKAEFHPEDRFEAADYA